MKDRKDGVTAAVVAAAAGAGWEWRDCHDLLHRLFTPACWGLPGGPARHLSLWRQYQGGTVLRRQSACRLGHHRYLPFWSGVAGPLEAPEGLLCLDCGRL